MSVKEDLTRYIETARWFGGKGRPFEVTASRRILLTASLMVAILAVLAVLINVLGVIKL